MGDLVDPMFTSGPTRDIGAGGCPGKGVGDDGGIAQLPAGSSCQTEAVLVRKIRKIRMGSWLCLRQSQGKGIRHCQRECRGQKQHDCRKPQACQDPALGLIEVRIAGFGNCPSLAPTALGGGEAFLMGRVEEAAAHGQGHYGELSCSAGRLEKRGAQSPLPSVKGEKRKLEGEK